MSCLHVKLGFTVALLFAFCAILPSAGAAEARAEPAADHHQHLFSPAIIALINPESGPTPCPRIR